VSRNTALPPSSTIRYTSHSFITTNLCLHRGGLGSIPGSTCGIFDGQPGNRTMCSSSAYLFYISIIPLMFLTHIPSLILPTDSAVKQKPYLPRVSALFLSPHPYAFWLYMRVISVQIRSNQECVFTYTLLH